VGTTGRRLICRQRASRTPLRSTSPECMRTERECERAREYLYTHTHTHTHRQQRRSSVFSARRARRSGAESKARDSATAATTCAFCSLKHVRSTRRVHPPTHEAVRETRHGAGARRPATLLKAQLRTGSRGARSSWRARPIRSIVLACARRQATSGPASCLPEATVGWDETGSAR